MDEEPRLYGSRIHTLTICGVVFVGLKLTGYLMWSWWLVLLPLYSPLVVVTLMIFYGIAFRFAAYLVRRDWYGN